MRVDLFDFDLPDDLIAQRPAFPRDSARLLDVAPGGLQDRLVRDLPGLLRRGDGLAFTGGLAANVEAKNEDGSVVLTFHTTGPAFLASLEKGGAVPLPPYIRGGVADAQDRADYQTLFAKYDGSVAAPTAGLHFTPGLMA